MANQSYVGRYLNVTPAGAYHCVNVGGSDSASQILKRILSCRECPKITSELIYEWAGIDMSSADEIIRRMESIRWLECVDTPKAVEEGKLEDILPAILEPLSSSNKVLLADGLGFYISSVGIPHETAEELSALSADLSMLSERHQGLLQGNLNMSSSNWGLVDAGGFGQIAFWPLKIDCEMFYLVTMGMPTLERAEFAQLIWVLHTRYASNVNIHSTIDTTLLNETTG